MFLIDTEYVALRGVPVNDPTTMSGKARALALTAALVAFLQRHILLTREYPA